MEGRTDSEETPHVQHLEELIHKMVVVLVCDGSIVEIVLEVVSQLHGLVHVETKQVHLLAHRQRRDNTYHPGGRIVPLLLDAALCLR